MAVKIPRTDWIDDDGSGTTGTVINNAEKTAIYNQIDAALAQVAQLNGGNTFTGNQAITGTIGVVGAGPHLISAAGATDVSVQVVNTLAGATARATILVGNNSLPYLTAIVANSSTIGTSIWPLALPNGSEIHGFGTGGLALSCDTSAPMRFCTANLERLRVLPTGEVCINQTVNSTANLMVGSDNAHTGIIVQNLGVTQVMNMVVFSNNVGGIAGVIGQTSSGTVTYNSGSDARLKTDEVRAIDLSALRAVVVYDFTWKADGVRDRGVFAQELAPLFPRVVTEGTDEMTDAGTLAHPWMTDNSKLVPDLIVGWQQHDAAIAELRAALAALKG